MKKISLILKDYWMGFSRREKSVTPIVEAFKESLIGGSTMKNKCDSLMSKVSKSTCRKKDLDTLIDTP